MALIGTRPAGNEPPLEPPSPGEARAINVPLNTPSPGSVGPFRGTAFSEESFDVQIVNVTDRQIGSSSETQRSFSNNPNSGTGPRDGGVTVTSIEDRQISGPNNGGVNVTNVTDRQIGSASETQNRYQNGMNNGVGPRDGGVTVTNIEDRQISGPQQQGDVAVSSEREYDPGVTRDGSVVQSSGGGAPGSAGDAGASGGGSAPGTGGGGGGSVSQGSNTSNKPTPGTDSASAARNGGAPGTPGSNGAAGGPNSLDRQAGGGGGSGQQGSDIEVLNKRMQQGDGGLDIIGLPPYAYNGHEALESIHTGLVKKRILACFGVMEITPALPSFGTKDENTGPGITLYNVDPSEEAANRYKDIVKGLDPSFPNPPVPLRVAFLNDVNISESWSNDYGDSSFESMVNVGSTRIQELRSITGANTASDALKKIEGELQGDGFFSNLTKGLISAASGFTNAGEQLISNVFGAEYNQLAAGSRVDFPMIWQGSNYTTSFSFTVRLYNPNPKDPQQYKEFIINPIARILALTLPYSDSPYTMNFPLLVKVNCPGLFCVDAGYISSIDVIKGGELNDITWKHQPGTVDLRITINNLYNTMIAEKSDTSADANKQSDRPTLKRYIKNMLGWAEFDKIEPDSASGGVGAPLTDPAVPTQNAPPQLEIPTGEEQFERVTFTDQNIPAVLDSGGTSLPIDTSAPARAITETTAAVDNVSSAIDDGLSGGLNGLNDMTNNIGNSFNEGLNGSIDETFGFMDTMVNDTLGNVTSVMDTVFNNELFNVPINTLNFVNNTVFDINSTIGNVLDVPNDLLASVERFSDTFDGFTNIVPNISQDLLIDIDFELFNISNLPEPPRFIDEFRTPINSNNTFNLFTNYANKIPFIG